MVGTDGQAVHRFRCAGEICAVIANQAACPDVSVPALALRVRLASGGRERDSVRIVVAAVHDSASPGDLLGLAQLFASC